MAKPRPSLCLFSPYRVTVQYQVRSRPRGVFLGCLGDTSESREVRKAKKGDDETMALLDGN